MKNRKNQSSTQSCSTPKSTERPVFSEAVMKVAKDNLKEFESRSDEAFLVRADMERKLSSL